MAGSGSILPPPQRVIAAADPHGKLNVIERANLPFGSWGEVVEAGRAGDRALAAEHAKAALVAHWQPGFGGWREYGYYWNHGEFDMDCFLSNPGYRLRILLLDLPRLTLGPGPVEDCCTESVVLPEGWESIEAVRIWVCGEPHRLTARHGAAKAHVETAEQ